MEKDDITRYFVGSSLKIIVKPNSGRNEIMGYDENKQALRVNIKAKPEANKANIEVIKFFTRLLKKKVTIILGLTGKEKILKIDCGS